MKNVLFIIVFLTGKAIAGESITHIPTAFLNLDYGATTYKSELMKQTDTGYTLRYALGGYIGEDKSIGVMLRTDQSAMNFALTGSQITSQWQDVVIRYRWGYFMLGAVISQATFVTAGDAVMEGSGSGYGGNMMFFFPTGKRSRLSVEVTTASISKFNEVDKKAVTLGSRLDIDIKSSVDITKKTLDFIYGYRRRTYALTVEGAGGNELLTTTYLGLQVETNF